MIPIIADALKRVKDPETLEDAADLLAFFPDPAPKIGAALRLAAAWLRSGKTLEEVHAIVARYSAEAQAVAEGWNG